MGDTGGSSTDFLSFALQLRNPRIPQETVASGALRSATSHFFKWGTLPPNEVGRATLPAQLVKPIESSLKSVLKNLDLGSEDP